MTYTHPPLVGLIGRKRSGKDTFAAVLVEEFGFRRIGFADPLRSAALALDPIIGRPAFLGNLAPFADVRLSEVVDALGWEAAKDLVPEVRRVLQRLGSDAIRALDRDFWVRMAMQEVDRARESVTAYAWGGQPVRTVGPTPVVMTDVRFPNEADSIRARGGVLLRIVRPSGDPGRLLDDEHASETALDSYVDDTLILNDQGVEDLQALARYFGSLTS